MHQKGAYLLLIVLIEGIVFTTLFQNWWMIQVYSEESQVQSVLQIQQDVVAVLEKGEEISEQSILLDVPFTPQAPFGRWSDPRQQDGCEEATVLMVLRFLEKKELDYFQSEREIIAASEFQRSRYGEFRDSSAFDTVERIVKEYYEYDDVVLRYDIGADEIKEMLRMGNPVIVPVNGQLLGNPHFTLPGPIQHMLVIRGYDLEKNEFITNDPGTLFGEGFRYSEAVLMNALQDYVTGYLEPIPIKRSAMIVIRSIDKIP